MTTARFNIEGRDKTGKAFNSVKGRLDRLDRSVSKLSRGFGALAGGAVVGGMGAIAKKSIDAADAIQKLGIRTGASAGFLSEMRYALSQNDVAMKDFEGALRKINKSSQEAGDGLSTQVRAFDKLGISVKAFQALGTDDKFKVLSEAISRVEDPAIRTQTAMDIMGRSGEQLLTVMQNGAGGIEEYLVKARDLNMTLSQEQVDSAAAANDAIDTLTKSFSGAATQSILQYSDEIARAADLTREYLPKAIGFLVDMFKGLKAVVEFVVSFVINRLGDLLTALSKIPVVGKHFDGMRDSVKLMGEVMDDQFESTVGSMGKWRDGAKDSEKAAKSLGGEVKKESAEIKKNAELFKALTGETVKTTKAKMELVKVTKTSWEEYKKANQVNYEFTNAIHESSIELTNTKKNQELFNKALEDGSISGELATETASKLGLKYEGLGEKTSIVSDAWEDANRKIFDSMQTFFRDGLDGWDNFGDSVKDIVKDMIASILAQITQLLVSNAFKKMISFLTNGKKFGGTGWTDGLGELFGGNSGGGGGGGGSPGTISNLSTAISTATTAFKMFGTKLGLGVGKTIGGGVYGGYAGGSALGGVGAAAATAAVAALAGYGVLDGIQDGGTKGHLQAGVSSAILFAINPVLGTIAAAITAISGVREIFGGGARTPQELGEDQLRAVDDATKAGRNTQVALGSVGGVATSFLGGFDENSTFFGVDLLKDELQKVGDVLKTKFGFDQALALKDGVIRLEDFSREFSANNEEIVAEVQASILIAKHAFDDAELAKVKSLGKSVIAMDRLYDQSADSGKSAADRLKEAYMGAFGASEDAATTALANMGLATERLAQIFDTSSNEILATLTGVATDGLGLFGQSISEMGTQADATFNQIEQRINGVSVAAQGGAGQVVNAYGGAYDRVQGLDDAFSRRLLQKLDQITDNSSVTRGNSQPLAGI